MEVKAGDDQPGGSEPVRGLRGDLLKNTASSVSQVVYYLRDRLNQRFAYRSAGHYPHFSVFLFNTGNAANAPQGVRDAPT